MDADPDQDLVSSITPDVMKCLDRSRLFEKLDDLLCPREDSHPSAACGRDYKLSEAILREAGFDTADLTDIFNVLRSQGGCCDCEILYNVVESSRLKAAYWRKRADSLDAKAKHLPHPARG